MARCAAYLSMLLIVFSLVFLSGCVERVEHPSQKEEIDRAWGIDTNNDGVFEEYYAFFKPVEIGNNLTIKREIAAERKIGYVVTNILRIYSGKTGIISNMEVKETIPISVSMDLVNINFNPMYESVIKSSPPFVVSWKFTFSGEEETEKDVTYTAVVNREIDRNWLESFVTPYVEVELVDVKSNPALVAINALTGGYLNALTATVPNYYVAVAIYASTLLCLFFIIYEMIMIIVAFLSSMLKKTKFRGELYKFIGRGRKSGMIWLIVGVALVIIGSVICVAMSESEGSVDMEMIARLASNSLLALGALMIVVGVASIYTVLMDLVKGSIFGEKYFFEPIDVAKVKITEIKMLMDDLQDRIEECSDYGIGTETELLFLSTGRKKLDGIEKSLDIENADEYLPMLQRIASDMKAEMIETEEKKTLYHNWPVWKESIDKTLITKDVVAPEDLISVPEEWRKWALTKYLTEHLGEALTIENGALVRIRLAAVRKGEIELVLNEFLGAGRIDGVALLRKDGLAIASNLPKDIDVNIIAAISAKVIANADMSSLELEKGKAKMIMMKSGGGETIIYGGKKVVLIALVKPGEAVGFIVSSMEKVMEKLEPMF